MSDVYIVYAREDYKLAEKLYNLLKDQWNVWWDRDMVDVVHKEVEREIPKTSCIVTLVSAISREKNTVIDELRLGTEHNKKIFPLKLDGHDLVYPYGGHSSIDFGDWGGEADHHGVLELKRKLAKVVPPTTAPKRPPYIGNIGMPLPMFFPSVSSYETQLLPSKAVQVLRLFGAQFILVSAYDLIPHCHCKSNKSQCLCDHESKALINELKKYRKEGGFVLVDSGKYEASRLADKSWKISKLKNALSQIPPDWAFCFDNLDPSKGHKKCVNDLITAIRHDSRLTSAPVQPIVHIPKNIKGIYKREYIPWIIREVAERLKPKVIAIPERELGDGLIARAKEVKRIRKELNNLPFYQPLHILGTGNPWTIPIFTAAGADSFDGLEWCRMSVDRDTSRLHHFQHYDFFAYQKGRAESPVVREFLGDSDINFVGKTIFHNLDYYNVFMNDMRKYIQEDNLEAFVVGIMGKDITNQLKQNIPGLFK